MCHIDIHIQRERERERERDTKVCTFDNAMAFSTHAFVGVFSASQYLYFITAHDTVKNVPVAALQQEP